jgi:hypothetical protein
LIGFNGVRGDKHFYRDSTHRAGLLGQENGAHATPANYPLKSACAESDTDQFFSIHILEPIMLFLGYREVYHT